MDTTITSEDSQFAEILCVQRDVLQEKPEALRITNCSRNIFI